MAVSPVISMPTLKKWITQEKKEITTIRIFNGLWIKIFLLRITLLQVLLLFLILRKKEVIAVEWSLHHLEQQL